MAKRMKPFIFTILLFCLSVALLSGCGNDQSVQDLYPLESVSKHGSEESMIYRAKNETVQSVARKISEEKKPEQESKEDNDKMFLVYSDCLYQLEKDQKNPSDTLIEASNKAFVEKNYGEEFLKGYLLASLLDQFFSLSNGQGHYRGYNEREAYPADQTYRTPTKKERKVTPPFVKEGLGKVIKRGEQAAASGQHSRQKKNITEPGDRKDL
ncbi:DUF4247 domain-containing protein [Terrilactibacillus sp. S3-3]|nr:DUF4247 domain-containing protein [Terrilactibacillus sp. S3-3]